ncbi:MAG TPA: AAA family ATPase [Thermoanaerobaculia bacterium]
MTDPTVLEALESAVAAAPDNDSLRFHLCDLLIAEGNPSRALQLCAELLSRRPDHAQAIAKVGEATAALQTTNRAAPLAEVVHLKAVSKDDDFEATASSVKLADVAGMDEVKRRLNLAFLAPMRNPEVRKMYGKSLRGGLLLYGPPGCGKTFIARATAGELGARFMSIGLSDVLDMWLGQSERNLHEIFETARRNAPCVLFFDEIDALGRKRSLMREGGGRNVVNQLLADMDSIGSDNDGVFVLSATNHPWDVDSALRRPGRFDRVLLVLPPDRPAREAILKLHLRERPVGDVDVAALAAKTDDFSGADLAHLCESAAELAMEESITTGNARPINQSDFKRALGQVKPSTRTWFDTARNYVQFANEGGMYDDLMAYMRTRRLL